MVVKWATVRADTRLLQSLRTEVIVLAVTDNRFQLHLTAEVLLRTEAIALQVEAATDKLFQFHYQLHPMEVTIRVAALAAGVTPVTAQVDTRWLPLFLLTVEVVTKKKN